MFWHQTKAELAAEIRRTFDYDPITGLFRKAGQDWHPGSIQKTGYAMLYAGRRNIAAHRVAFAWMTGQFPANIDHINGIKHDNRWCNLRRVTAHQNAINVDRGPDAGVYRKGVHGRNAHWGARIRHQGHTYNLGNFPTREEARAEYVKARIACYGDLNHHTILTEAAALGLTIPRWTAEEGPPDAEAILAAWAPARMRKQPLARTRTAFTPYSEPPPAQPRSLPRCPPEPGQRLPKNIQWHTTSQSYRVRFRLNGRRIEAGKFRTLEQAIAGLERAKEKRGIPHSPY
jgi:hypothetical protein